LWHDCPCLGRVSVLFSAGDDCVGYHLTNQSLIVALLPQHNAPCMLAFWLVVVQSCPEQPANADTQAYHQLHKLGK
jgi:hypothetical protein